MFKRGFWVLMTFCCLAGCTPEPSATLLSPTVPATTPTPPRPFRMVGYVMDWETAVERIPYDKLTHINYAFLLPQADGSVVNVAHPDQLQTIVTAAHQQNVKVLISVGGWGYDAAFEQLAATPESQARFVTSVLAFVAEYQLDGVDIDWEYPDEATAVAYLELMQALHQALSPRDKLLTAAVVASGDNAKGVLPAVFAEVNFLNLMAYDGPDLNHSSLAYAQEALTYWHEQGLPAEKTVLGVPFYARPLEVSYRQLVAHDTTAVDQDQTLYQDQTVYYNGRATIQQKTTLALHQASGIMIWALAQDTNDDTSLVQAIYQTSHP